MDTQLFRTLELQPHDILIPNTDVHQDSISNAKIFLDPLALTKSTSVSALHVADFDVEQIWEQAKALLDQIFIHSKKTNHTVVTSNPSRKRHKRNSKTEQTSSHNIGAELESSAEDSDVPDDSSYEDVISAGGSGVDEPPRASLGRGRDVGFDRPQNRASAIDDQFFSIERFNRETEQFELADELGEPVNGQPMEIDWNVDPGDELDLSASEASDIDDDARHGIMYTDFFDVPTGSLKGNGKREARVRSPHLAEARGETAGEGLNPESHLDGAEDILRLIDSMQEDLFQERKGHGNDEDENSDYSGALSGSNGEDNLFSSSHTQRQAALNDQIRKLEKQNVSKREWTLSGEARAQQRPFNSLLEEDLDFERTGKAVPVITSEITGTLEDMIKSRILAGQFDDLPRRQPGELNVRRIRATELDDSKSKVGLAEVYEQDHLRLQDPANNPSLEDAKWNGLKMDISELFSSITQQLDVLSSWQFTPKVPKPNLSVVHDIRTLAMEEANINSNSATHLNSTALAPQDVFNPSSSENQPRGTVNKHGIPTSRSEMGRDQKAKERRLRKKQQRGTNAANKHAVTGKDNDILKTLQAGKVSVIGKSGETTNISGKPKTTGSVAASSSMKL